MSDGTTPPALRRSRRVGVKTLAVLATVLLGTLLASVAAAAPAGHAPPFQPLDPQNYVLPEHQTWSEYQPVPGTNWGDPSLTPSIKRWRTALVFVDFPDQQPIISLPKGGHISGNPQVDLQVPRDDVPEFYADFLNTPQVLNNGVTMNKYWMENSLGRYGVELVPFGVYRMQGNQWEYHLRDAGNAGSACPTGFTCNRNVRSEALAAWRAEQGATINTQFDNVFYMMAGHDESSTWQEWGEMMFQDRDAVTDPWGNPDETKPNWSPTRYVPWSSFLAAQNIWPSASGNSSTEAESSGMGVFAHELSHNLGIGDNYNNPYGIPLRRTYTGPWDMLSRGSFNGPGGPHTRWNVPAALGASLGSNHNVRNRLKLGFLKEENLLRLDSAALTASGLAVAKVTARAADPGPDGLTGVNVNMPGGDRTPACSLTVTADCPATQSEQNSQRYNNYTLEVVQRIGNDSFLPGHGVLISRTKNGPSDRSPFVWVIDAHPEDISVVDFRRPNGDEAMYSYGDYRQLADATFNAGLESGTEYEYVDTANRLHFYVVDVEENADGVLSYTVAARSLDGSGPQPRGTQLGNGTTKRVTPAWAAHCNFPLTNTGGAGPIAGTHPEDASAFLGSDVYRLSSSLQGDGWTAGLYNALATAKAGETVNVPVYVTRTPGAANRAVVTLTATSESDPTKTATATCNLKVSDLNK